MQRVDSISLKIKEMLEHFGRKNMTVGALSFAAQKSYLKRRWELRHKLIKEIKQHKGFKRRQKNFKAAQLLNIGGKPEGSIASVSISHTKEAGVFLFIFDKRLSIGFDMERPNRVTKKIIERVSSKEEIRQAPASSLLWTAKEAGFKCLSDNKETLFLSDCVIFQWTQKKFFAFQCYSKKTNQRASGVAGFIDKLAIAYAETPV